MGVDLFEAHPSATGLISITDCWPGSRYAGIRKKTFLFSRLSNRVVRRCSFHIHRNKLETIGGGDEHYVSGKPSRKLSYSP